MCVLYIYLYTSIILKSKCFTNSNETSEKVLFSIDLAMVHLKLAFQPVANVQTGCELEKICIIVLWIV